ncbi:hypothetical protein TEQG_05560 [Trichophyton equinum CBS 127.97]|uniref:Uncharacterized protein n=1 Tax=Trichophyton equinum (strain ATCC MYA-4606 / CBS 127.97) TaxID=559882 RepID=F2PXE3_TRIEC|nr:hypothetical protein TEQG_05560 [Trichophyton equinum CBS 127.97]
MLGEVSANTRDTKQKCVYESFFESLAYGCMRSHRMRPSPLSLGGFMQVVSSAPLVILLNMKDVNEAVQINFAIALVPRQSQKKQASLTVLTKLYRIRKIKLPANSRHNHLASLTS